MKNDASVAFPAAQIVVVNCSFNKTIYNNIKYIHYISY